MRNFHNIPSSNAILSDANLEEKSMRKSTTHPIDLYVADFNQYSIPLIQHHWHEKIQFWLVLEGQARFEIAGDTFTLQQGEGVFINSNIIHVSTPDGQQDTQLYTLLFDPSALGGVDQVGLKYVRPILDCQALHYLILKPQIDWQKDILTHLMQILNTAEEQNFGYELEQKNELGILWLILVRNVRSLLTERLHKNLADEARIKTMLEFIHQNYASSLTLSEIAGSAQLSKSECCRCFQRTLRLSPFEYLIQIRISAAASLILTTNRSIGDIAESVGFNGLSYFHKTFKSILHMTPMEFRKSGGHAYPHTPPAQEKQV